MANIFQISNELLDILQEIEDNGGEITEEIEAQLAISQADFKTKIQSYSDVVKQLLSDISLIDKEAVRLKELKDSKKKTIERLKKIMVWAIEMFGDTSKTGGKFVDYGTGKVSVRKSEAVEVNEELTDTIVHDIFYYLTQLDFTHEIDEGVDVKDLLKTIKESTNNSSISEDELSSIKANLNFDVNIKDLIEGEGFEFTKHFLKFIKNYKTKSSVDKLYLKSKLKEGNKNLDNIANVVTNKNLQIK